MVQSVTTKKINLSKTKLMLFNPCYSKDFLPDIKVDDSPIELVEQTKLLGLIITSDLSWNANTEYIVDKWNKKLWMIRRLKKLGADEDDLKDVYNKQIRSVLEFGVPVWNGSLSGENVAYLERIQKILLHIILGDKFHSYRNALK